MVSIIMSLRYIITPFPPLSWGIDRVFRFIGFYAIGTVLASLEADEKIRKIQTPARWGIAIVLLMINFTLSYMELDTGIMWFVTAMTGTTAVLIISIAVNKNRILEYLGRISLIILCVHGPVYRILIKVMAVLLRMSTDAVRGNFVLSLIITAFTLYMCVIAYQIINRFMPWMIGREKLPR